MNYISLSQIAAFASNDVRILTIIGIITIIAYCGKTFLSNEPDLNSKLNNSQIFSVITFISLVAGISYFLYNYIQSGFLDLVIIIVLLVQVFSILYWIYDPLCYVISSIKAKFSKNNEEFKEISNHNHKIGVIVCAHNEEEVVGNLLESIDEMDYDKKSYDTYVICDNCTDSTQEIVDKSNAKKMVRYNETKIGKGYAIEWFFKSLKNDLGNYDQYDAFVILDADNLVNREFLTKINESLNKGHEVIQAYLGCKNPDDSWVSKSYSICYWITNDMFQRAHTRMGISSQLGGTGMVFRREILDEIGLSGGSLTEDLLFSTQYVLKTNKSCHWEEGAIILDEKPLNMFDSIKQRTRWMQGHMATCAAYFLPLLVNAIKNRSFRQFDAAVYLIKPALNFILMIGYLIMILTSVIIPVVSIPIPYIVSWEFFTVLLLSYVGFYSLILFKSGNYKYIIWIPLIFIYSITYYIPIFRGIVKRNEQFWVKTNHTSSIRISGNKQLGSKN